MTLPRIDRPHEIALDLIGLVLPTTPQGRPMKLPIVIFAAIFMNMLSSLSSVAATCESLTALKLPDTAIRLAQTLTAGAFNPPLLLSGAWAARRSHLGFSEGASRVLQGSCCHQALDGFRNQV